MEHLDLKRRLTLQSLLKEIPKVREVYFQPPEDIKLKFPCIIYKWDRMKEIRADNTLYNSRRGYSVTIVDQNPDSTIPIDFQKEFPLASFDRSYVSDNMNHWIYNLYW